MKINVSLGLSTILGLSLIALAQPAHAATFDFNALATGNEHGAVSESFTDDGITVTASGRSLDGTLTHFMYLDEQIGVEGPGGLGVCKDLGTGECTPGNDDNTTFNEVLELVFSSPVVISLIEFSNGSHVDVYNGSFGVAIDSTPTSVGDFTLFPMSAVFNGTLSGTKFSFISDSTISGIQEDTHYHYISLLSTDAPIPEPATLGLLGLGLLGAALRRPKQS